MAEPLAPGAAIVLNKLMAARDDDRRSSSDRCADGKAIGVAARPTREGRLDRLYLVAMR